MKKRRKGGNRQHLDKVDQHSHNAAVHEQALERQAVMDVMGMGDAGGAAKVIMWIVGGLLLAMAVVGLLALTVF